MSPSTPTHAGRRNEACGMKEPDTQGVSAGGHYPRSEIFTGVMLASLQFFYILIRKIQNYEKNEILFKTCPSRTST